MTQVSRRQFLKIGAAGVGLAALGEALGTMAAAAQEWGTGRSVSRTTGLARRAVPSTCQLCPARCGILGFVEDTRLVKIEGNPAHPNNRGRLCAKGQAGLNLLYDPERLLHPLRRAGARGEGRWEEVSWEEAYAEVAERLRALREAGRPQELVFLAGSMANQPIVSRFLDAYGTPNAINRYPHSDYNKAVAQRLTWGASVEVNDLAHTKYILNFGANPYEAYLFHLPLVQRLLQGRLENEAKLVTFDVRLSNTAGRSDEWFPLRPGSDGLVALAMAHVIVQEGLHDREFLEAWTNYPSEELARYLSRFTPELAEGESGIPARDIRRIALEFATSKPGTTLSGAGVTMHRHGVQNERSVALLNAITGNIDVRGGYCLPRSYPLAEPEPAPPQPQAQGSLADPALSPFGPHVPSHGVMALIREGRQKVGVFMTYMHNPVYSNPDHRLNREALQDEKLIPFFVAVDTSLSESAALADLILPDATYLERWDLESGPSFEMVPFISLRQPVVSPRGQAVPFHDVCLELAGRIGGGMEKYFKFGSAEAYLRRVAEGVPGLAAAGGLDYLKERGVWVDPEARPEFRSYRQRGFATPSGKFEVYSRALEERGFSALPDPTPDLGGVAGGQLILVTYKANVLTSANANSKWVSEIEHDNPLLVNDETARARGLEDGAWVKVTSALGSLTVRVRRRQGIHPQVVALCGGHGHWGLGRIAQGEKFSSPDPDTQLLWWQGHGNGVCPNEVVPLALDPAAGGQAWNGIPVEVALA